MAVSVFCFCFLLAYCEHAVWSLVSIFFFKQKTAYEMRISDWSSDVCSSDLWSDPARHQRIVAGPQQIRRIGGNAAIAAAEADVDADLAGFEIGRASCRERVCQYV